MMRQDTDELIRRLVTYAQPVRPLPRPWSRAAVWLVYVLPYVGLMIFVLRPRDDLAAKMTDPRFVVEAATALATGVAAAIAAFATVVPGYSRIPLAALLAPLAAWVGSLGAGCVQDWIQLGPEGLVLRTDWSCLPAILFTGAVPTIAMAAMLRRGAPLTPTLSMALGGLAAGALADFGLRFHHREAGVMVLVWHLGAVVLLLAAASKAGPYVLNWRAVVLADRAASSG